MKINILHQSQNELQIELVDESHSFANTLQSSILKDDTIEFVGYNISHPLMANPVLFIRTKAQRRPEDALLDAAKRLVKELTLIENTLKSNFNI